MNLTKNAEMILKKRYLLKDRSGKVIETPPQMFKRVAKAIAKIEKKFDPSANISGIEKKFYELMSEGVFLPNSPTLMNASTDIGQLSACFVIPVKDSLKDIFEALSDMAIIHQSGGGTGFNFGALRPKNARVKASKGIASGPVSFMKIFDSATEVIRQGGRRRGANMGILPVDHPDILEFINVKKDGTQLKNFNLSVGVTDRFMEAAKKGLKYSLKEPGTNKSAGKLIAAEVLNMIADAAYESGDPGLLFMDRIKKGNPTPKIGEIEATNPCGEQPLLPYEACTLGSINVSKFIKNRNFNFENLKEVIHLAVRFLDDVIDANKYPLPQIEKISLANRKIGLGVMGFADALIKMDIQYNSQKAVAFAEKLMKFFSQEAHKASQELGKMRGSFPNFNYSVFKTRTKFMRNASVTTIAPTGTLSIIAGCSSGIEPIFAVSYVRKGTDGMEDIIECCPVFEEITRKTRCYKADICRRILNEGGLEEISEIPQEIKNLFTPAENIQYDWHVQMAAAFQKYTDAAVSKTVNLPKTATKDDIRNIFFLAYKNKCKGITVFRRGCKNEQILSVKPEDTGRITVESDYSGGCPVGYCAV